MANTVFHPTAGYIYDAAKGATPGELNKQERSYLRTLAGDVAAAAEDPKYGEKRRLWYRHNGLEETRPLQLVFPEDSWQEILGEDQLQVADPFWRQWERYLKHLLYRHQHFCDDFVIEPELYITLVTRGGGWNLKPRYRYGRRSRGSYVWEAPLRRLEDRDSLRSLPLEVDDESTVELLNKARGCLLTSCRCECTGRFLPPTLSARRASCEDSSKSCWICTITRVDCTD